MASKNLRAKEPTRAEAEMAVRAVEGIPNAMDMDFTGIDPDPTSLDIASENGDFVADAGCSNHEHPVHECIFCGQPLAEE